MCPPLPGKVIMLYFYTSSETLSPRFSLAPVHRGQAFCVSRRILQEVEMIDQRLNEGRGIGLRNQVLPMVEKEEKVLLLLLQDVIKGGFQIIQLEGESNSILQSRSPHTPIMKGRVHTQ